MNRAYEIYNANHVLVETLYGVSPARAEKAAAKVGGYVVLARI